MHDTDRSSEHEGALAVNRRHMPYELDEGIGHRCRIGLIVLGTDQTIEHEFRRIYHSLDGVALYESRIYNSPSISKESLAEMENGIAGATALIVPNLSLDVVCYACNSGAMVIGEDAVRARIHESRPGVACTTPMEAAFAAFDALGSRRICFIPPYADEINWTMRDFMVKRGYEVPVMGSWNITDDTDVARLSEQTVRTAVLELGGADEVDVVFVACTSIRLAGQVEKLEAELGKPVTSSNHATAWHCLRLAGHGDEIPGFGRLFRRGLG